MTLLKPLLSEITGILADSGRMTSYDLGKVSDGLGKVSDGLGKVSDGLWKVSDGLLYSCTFS